MERPPQHAEVCTFYVGRRRRGTRVAGSRDRCDAAASSAEVRLRRVVGSASQRLPAGRGAAARRTAADGWWDPVINDCRPPMVPLACENGSWWDPGANVCRPPLVPPPPP